MHFRFFSPIILNFIGNLFIYTLKNFYESEFCDYDEFIMDYKARMERMNKTQTRFWKNKIKFKKNLKHSWVKFLEETFIKREKFAMNSDSPDCKFIVNSIFEIIRSFSLFF